MRCYTPAFAPVLHPLLSEKNALPSLHYNSNVSDLFCVLQKTWPMAILWPLYGELRCRGPLRRSPRSPPGFLLDKRHLRAIDRCPLGRTFRACGELALVRVVFSFLWRQNSGSDTTDD